MTRGRAPAMAALLRVAAALILGSFFLFDLPARAADAPTADDLRAASLARRSRSTRFAERGTTASCRPTTGWPP